MTAGDDQDSQLHLDELRQRYRVEREKRLRPEGIRQYRELSEIDEEFDRDPFADPSFTRDPVVDNVGVTIVGAGFGGMLAAINLVKAGIRSFRIIDRAADFGGTWYWNRSPGAACDVESYVYLPLLEDTGYMPTEKAQDEWFELLFGQIWGIARYNAA